MWKRIPGYPKYEANEDGRIRQAETLHLMRFCKAPEGHFYLALCGPDKKRHKVWVQRIILATFCRHPRGREVARHLDGNPANNKISNLAWGSTKKNMKDKQDHGRAIGSKLRLSAMLTPEGLASAKDRLNNGLDPQLFASCLGVSLKSVYNLKNGRTYEGI